MCEYGGPFNVSLLRRCVSLFLSLSLKVKNILSEDLKFFLKKWVTLKGSQRKCDVLFLLESQFFSEECVSHFITKASGEIESVRQ